MIANLAIDHAMDADPESPFDWPAFGLMDDIRPALGAALESKTPAVLATLYDVVGGAPRGTGAQMLFTADGMTGFLSGGCIEADLALHAEAVLADGAPRRVVYGEGGPADIRLPCGSRIDVLLERVAPDDAAAARLIALTDRRRTFLWVTDGVRRACLSDDGALDLPLHLRAAAALTDQNSCGHVDQPFALYRAYTPPLHLVVIGGDPIALAVVRLATEMGIEITLIRPKGPQAPPFALRRYRRGTVEEALAELKPDPWTAVAVLTHEPDQEHAALKAALASEAGYVGALGSRRRIPQRIARLQAAGLSIEDTARVHAPIGLAIGGKSPWEIAVSIIAEIVAEVGRPKVDREIVAADQGTPIVGEGGRKRLGPSRQAPTTKASNMR